MANEAFQVLSSCPTCKVEAAVVELIDPQVAQGVAAESRCRLCGREEAGGEIVHLGVPPDDVEEAQSLLARWAAEEGEPDVDVFCGASFCGLSLRQVCEALVARKPLATSFDVVAFLFPGMGGGAGGGMMLDGDGGLGSLPKVVDGADVPEERTAPRADKQRMADREIAARALAAVMLADGQIRPGERRFMDGFLARTGAVLQDDHLRHWRPADLPFPAEPGPIIEAMIELAYADRQKDGTEWRVVREFARHWQYPVERIEAVGRRRDEAAATTMQRLWGALRSLLVSES